MDGARPLQHLDSHLDPYTLAHLAALSALAAPPSASQANALLRQMQGLLYPFAITASEAMLQHATGSSHPPPSSSPSLAGKSALDESTGHHWISQLSGANHPSLASQHLPPLMLPPSQTLASSSRRSASATPSPTTSRSPTTPRTEQFLDEAAISEDKRRRNTAASARFRIKKKHKTLALERSVVELEARADDLEREAAELRRENGWLKEMLIMKGRSMRTALAAASLVEDEGNEESTGEEDEEAEKDTEASDAQRTNSAKEKGKGKAT